MNVSCKQVTYSTRNMSIGHGCPHFSSFVTEFLMDSQIRANLNATSLSGGIKIHQYLIYVNRIYTLNMIRSTKLMGCLYLHVLYFIHTAKLLHQMYLKYLNWFKVHQFWFNCSTDPSIHLYHEMLGFFTYILISVL